MQLAKQRNGNAVAPDWSSAARRDEQREWLAARSARRSRFVLSFFLSLSLSFCHRLLARAGGDRHSFVFSLAESQPTISFALHVLYFD